jgi:hypothetical protein
MVSKSEFGSYDAPLAQKFGDACCAGRAARRRRAAPALIAGTYMLRENGLFSTVTRGDNVQAA